jgi:hypothetical protein
LKNLDLPNNNENDPEAKFSPLGDMFDGKHKNGAKKLQKIHSSGFQLSLSPLKI